MAHPFDHDPAPVYCSTCGRESDPGARFCDNCGAVLDPGPGSPAYAPGMPYFEQGAQNVEYMGFWIRLAAAVIDGILLFIVNLLVGFLLGLAGSPLSILVNLLIGWAYHVGFIAAKGQTIGKMAVGIQVVDNQGNIPGIGAVLLRETIGKFLSGIAIGLGYLWVVWDKEKRGWHDHIAGTYVVRKGADSGGHDVR